MDEKIWKRCSLTLPATAPERPDRPALLLRQIKGLALRHVYLHLGSWPRFVEMFYWPIVNMASWGFASVYIMHRFEGTAALGPSLVAGVLLSEMLVRVQVTMLMLFMEEMWSRNLGHLFASPLSFTSYITGTTAVALVRSALAITPALILAAYLFNFSILSLGWPLAAYIPLLAMSGVWCGNLILALILRYGLAAEWLAWMATWFLLPLTAPYYPVSILPAAMQATALALPPTYVFESVKSQIAGNGVHPENLLISLGLNLLYLAGSAFVLRAAWRSARCRGGLLQMGE